MTEPAEFTTARAATTMPSTHVSCATILLAEPTPPCRPRDLAPEPAPTAPLGEGRSRAAVAARRPKLSSGRLSKRPPRPRSKITAAGTIGTTSCSAGPTEKPTRRPSRNAITPEAAASPYALPPVRQIACTSLTVEVGCNRSVSRVPGPPPRTSTPPTVPRGSNTTVVPVDHPRLKRDACPTRIPGTSVRQPPCPLATGRFTM